MGTGTDLVGAVSPLLSGLGSVVKGDAQPTSAAVMDAMKNFWMG